MNNDKKEINKCNNITGNDKCDYTVLDKPKKCNFEERQGCSYLDCQYYQKFENNIK
ncbi:MAG: hypothetical protein K0R54_195 [Clostridiaceae bacterium]|jgi:hypothetical protein|nr:hypothetical protein [Clostridiaceae bacterium]